MDHVMLEVGRPVPFEDNPLRSGGRAPFAPIAAGDGAGISGDVG